MAADRNDRNPDVFLGSVPYWERPLAVKGLVSYRYRGNYGWIMLGARNDDEALREARRSTTYPVDMSNLEVWTGQQYEWVGKRGSNL